MTEEFAPRTIRPAWTLVMDRMILVDLHIYRWRAATRAEFNEFGLDAGAFRAYTAGARHLLPRRIQTELDRLERMARDLQIRLSYHTLFGYLMPKERYDEFKVWMDEKPAAELRRYLHNKNDSPESWQTASLRERWFALAEEIAATRDAIIDEVIEAYRPSAIMRWRIENRLPKDSAVEPADEWLDDILESMVKRIPTRDQIRDSFQLDVVPAFVEAPDEAVKAAKLEDIARQEAEVQRRLNEISRIHVEEEREKARLALEAEREKLNRERRITEEIIAHEKRLKTDRIERTLNDVAGQLHSLVYGAVVDGLAQIQDKGRLHPRWVGRVKDLVERVQLLNFTDDAELARVCGELGRMVDVGAASEANATRMRAVLVDVGISLKADLLAANVPTRSARDLGIPDEPMPELVRRARREIPEPDLFSQNGDTAPTLARSARSLETAAV